MYIVDVLNKLTSARIYWSIDLAKYEVDPTRIAIMRENAKQIQVILSYFSRYCLFVIKKLNYVMLNKVNAC